MSTSLSSLVDNLSEIYKKEYEGCEEKEKIKSVCNFIGLKNNKLNYECKECKKRWLKPVNGLIKKFPNANQFCNGDINKFILLLRKGVYLYQYINSREIFNDTSLPDKKISLQQIRSRRYYYKDYAHAQKVFEELKLTNVGDYHDFYVQSDALLLADVFENFRDKCIEIYELDPAHFLSSSGLAWQACLKKTKVELELLTNMDMLLMAEKGTRSRICQAMHTYAKANNEYSKNYDKNTTSSHVMYLDANNLYGWVMFQKLPVNGFERV